MQKEYSEIVVVGAGPSGTTFSHFLANAKVKHIILDKAMFPREKICGDGLTVEVMRRIYDMNKDMFKEYTSSPDKFRPSYGYKFYAPNGRKFEYSIPKKDLKYPPYFVGKRSDLDALLVKYLNKDFSDLRVNTVVTDIVRENGKNLVYWKTKGSEGVIECDLVVGGDGERSIVKKKLHPGGNQKIKEFSAGAVRTYFKNVEGISENGELELFFLKDLLPGYFWIFPLPNGECNVGIGMFTPHIMDRKVNLKKRLLEICQEHPLVKDRFEKAEMLDSVKGMGIPMNGHKTKLFGEGYILLGDAGTLAEQATAKGIGSGMDCAKYAAEVVIAGIQNGDLSPSQLKLYHQRVYSNYEKHWNLLYTIQKMLNYPLIANLLPVALGLTRVNKKFRRDALKWTNLG